ncbi:helix-turn-helix domain-containing protein [Candidatus Contubernalis alkaliaceticus]|uniref:helix-turn-helix domain-containing protein n=1 Tax=Candidatus Contubernalis alkaliaceticus TaxID=338645 RepID=UPI001F4C3907|nr:helix-turn-helix domain-containing protein [Candidatus Contubernalis alkalaceticus]UNC91980.1 helix-turn-helix transcriptional regulator [Candidatus Contubernalis alkalaceticus]
MKCEKCDIQITEAEAYTQGKKTFCEDCYIEENMKRPQPCDPGAVRSAVKTREMLGQTGTDGLLPLQKNIYEFIKDKGKATHQEIMEEFNLSPKDLQKDLAILRHCELVKGTKEGNTIYMLLMN